MTGWAILAAFAAAVAASFWFLRLDVAGVFTAEGLASMANYAGAFFPPTTAPDFLATVLRASGETLAISAVGTLLAVAAGIVLAVPAAGRAGIASRVGARLALNFLRAIPELVWAALMVLAAGLGPFAGALALALHTTGVLGRLFAESLENAPPEPTVALRDAGTPALAAFCYGTVPTVLPQLVSYTLYRWENNIRMAAVLGLVGAGGLGQMLYVSLSLFQQSAAATVIIAMLLLVAAVDGASAWLRRRLTPGGR
ncbi:MAG: phosphonate ABC transporter, permease protein PhnE [Pseudomonadota bacterium]